MAMFGLQHRKSDDGGSLAKPFWIVEFPDDNSALKFASRSVALRSVAELWSHSTVVSTFHEKLQNYAEENKEYVSEFFGTDKRFKITVETYNKHLSQREKIDRIESFDYLPIGGAVDLRDPHVEWLYIEFWGLDPKSVPESPGDLLFGRLLAQGQRELIKALSLKKRKFIGNTSMDAQLSLLMANQGKVKDGDLVLDPFVGTGSLLVSAAKFGGYVLGTDIDFMMLHARCRPSRITQKTREKDESVRSNLKQYGCENRYLDVLVSDFSNPLWRDDLQFDSIITDPPYGIREATERVEKKLSPKEEPATRSSEMPHYPSTSHYSLQHIYEDLLIFAANHLKVGGRLVCWMPFHRADYAEGKIPLHTCLRLVANSEQPLTGLTCRRLLTYEKICEPSTKDNRPELIVAEPLTTDFRERYFDFGEETRKERRMRNAAIRELGRQEALKRGKPVKDSRELKCLLNKARFE